MNHFQPVVLAVIEKDGTFLFTKRIDDYPAYHGKWQLPGGGMEFAETPEEAMRREIREELGVEVGPMKLIPFIDTKVRNEWHGIFISFHCKLDNPAAEIILNEEASEYRWFTREELDYAKFPIFEGCVEIVEKSDILSHSK
ncbi:NUDIX hydrolase [Candidatus Woesebacteria bacterium]|nr:NUDIX hydrolase [Candidatus Woesebacteria bacterium]